MHEEVCLRALRLVDQLVCPGEEVRIAEASCVNLFQDGPQRVNPGGPEPVLPTGLPCELHSSPDWAWRSPEKQNGDPRHSCSNVEFTIVTRRRPGRTRQEVTNHERELPPRGGAGGAGSKSVGGSRNGHLKRGVTAYKSGSRRSWSAAFARRRGSSPSSREARTSVCAPQCSSNRTNAMSRRLASRSPAPGVNERNPSPPGEPPSIPKYERMDWPSAQVSSAVALRNRLGRTGRRVDTPASASVPSAPPSWWRTSASNPTGPTPTSANSFASAAGPMACSRRTESPSRPRSGVTAIPSRSRPSAIRFTPVPSGERKKRSP